MTRWAPPAGADVLAVIAAGGAIGALARYGAGSALPTPPRGFPWATLLVNASGCLLIGVLLTVLARTPPAVTRLTRPFLGTGVLGGYTTFSTYAVETQRLIENDAAGTALLYLAATVLAALLSVWLGATATRAAQSRRHHTTAPTEPEPPAHDSPP